MRHLSAVGGLILVLLAFSYLGYGDVTVFVEEHDGFSRAGEPVTLGIPFARGQLSPSAARRLVDSGGTGVDAQFKPMATWDDGSIKWLKCDFQADVAANGSATYTFKSDGSHTVTSSLSAAETNQAITVNTGPLRFTVSKTAFNVLDEVWLDFDGDGNFTSEEQIISQGLSNGPFVTKDGTTYLASNHAPDAIEIEEQGPMKIVIKVSGRHYNGPDSLLKYETRIYAYKDKPYIKLWHVYANGQSVETLSYPLAESTRAVFDQYGLNLRLNLKDDKQARFGGSGAAVVSLAMDAVPTTRLVQQDRSAGDDPYQFNIYNNGALVLSGDRASGWATMRDEKWGLTMAGRYFWQKYPKGFFFENNGSVSFMQSPSAETLWVGMGTGDEILLYFHPRSHMESAGPLARALAGAPLLPRCSANAYTRSQAFYTLDSGTTPYTAMADYISTVTANHLANRDALGIYGTINFGDSPVDYWGVDQTQLDATGWGNNYYDGCVLTPIRLFAREGHKNYPDIFIPGARFFMETACWNTDDPDDWLNGYCPAYSSYHRATAHFQHHYGEGLWYYYYLTGDERAREVGLRAAASIKDQQWWGNSNVDCRMAYQRGSACMEAWKNTGNTAYQTHTRLLLDKILDTQDNYGLIGAVDENGVVWGEQTFMMALFADTVWKYARELATDSAEREQLTAHLRLLADCVDTYARKAPGEEEYWNFFPAPDNATPPQPVIDEDNPDATVYWFGKGLIAGLYAYTYDLTGETRYRTLARNLLAHMWETSQIDWSGSEFWMKPSAQVMKNLPHAVALVNAPASAELTLLSPNGGESWQAGSQQTITWSYTGAVDTVFLEFSPDQGENPVIFASDVPNTGSYNWTVPQNISGRCQVTVVLSDGSLFDTSDGVFSIVPVTPVSVGVDRERLNFTALQSGVVTGAQSLGIRCDSEWLHWTVTSDAAWLSVDRAAGKGTGRVSVSASAVGLGPGTYTGILTVAAPGATETPLSVAVSLEVKGTDADERPFGEFATPLQGAAVSGSVAVTGWALDDVGVESVTVYADGAYIGDAYLVEGARPDVEAAYPQYPFAYRAGWGYMLLTHFLPGGGNGRYTLSVVARDGSGNAFTLGSRVIVVDNAAAVLPFGAIDTPRMGREVSGQAFRNAGWVLTPQPGRVPGDGSSIMLWVDGVRLDNSAVYSIFREDIAALFPGYANSGGAGGYFDLDTTAFANGVHTIAWSVEDDMGRAEGVGSRYFSILNGGESDGANVAGVALKGDEKVTVGDVVLHVGRGYGRGMGLENIRRDETGTFHLRVEECSRMELGFSLVGEEHSRYLCLSKGFLKVGDKLKALPIGSLLKGNEGKFYWQLGPGFVGRYTLVFDGANNERFEVEVEVVSKR